MADEDYTPEEREPLFDACKFRVGDTVRVKTTPLRISALHMEQIAESYNAEYNGRVGTVIKLSLSSSLQQKTYFIGVKLMSGETCYLHENALEKLDV